MIKDPETNLIFDDYCENTDPDTKKHWTQLCEEHAVHSSPTLQEIPGEGYICGVEGCSDVAVYYYDFDGIDLEEHPDYPIEDWKYEVANNDTKLGYKEWLEHKIEDSSN